ncbi:hypothetical protein SEA_GALACTIC_68 [Mycobacterium phage Galactic]|uniref:Uncharacterized protein n=1 Tax=Mycobacterium phage Galactic TaxID=2301612 RepID=A0A385UC48_9CAUD|nr:hypothetical protein I5H41_gp068 [Mycobacterium phage Galactic]AYB69302.1 hypothetical protein SEA_GALACTIC_68 [Mycobacterium phage Galactic]
MKIGSLFSGAEGVNLMDAEALSTWRKRRRYHRSAWGRPSMPIPAHLAKTTQEER